MTLNCRGNMLLSIVLTALLWELSIGRSIGKNGICPFNIIQNQRFSKYLSCFWEKLSKKANLFIDNETLYDENLDHAVTTSSTVAQEWTSAFTNVPSTNDTEKGNSYINQLNRIRKETLKGYQYINTCFDLISFR